MRRAVMSWTRPPLVGELLMYTPDANSCSPKRQSSIVTLYTPPDISLPIATPAASSSAVSTAVIFRMNISRDGLPNCRPKQSHPVLHQQAAYKALVSNLRERECTGDCTAGRRQGRFWSPDLIAIASSPPVYLIFSTTTSSQESGSTPSVFSEPGGEEMSTSWTCT